MKKLIIFDFDGVLIDSFDALYKINKEAAELVDKKLTKERYRGFFVGNVHKKREDFLKDKLKIDKYNTERARIFPIYYNNSLIFFKFVHDLLAKISRNADLCIVSSSPEDRIEHLLKENNLSNYFFELHGTNAGGKRQNLDKYVNLGKYDDVFFVTDTSGDIFEARGLKIKTVAVTWGFHDKKILVTAKPSFVVSTHEELLSVLL